MAELEVIDRILQVPQVKDLHLMASQVLGKEQLRDLINLLETNRKDLKPQDYFLKQINLKPLHQSLKEILVIKIKQNNLIQIKKS